MIFKNYSRFSMSFVLLLTVYHVQPTEKQQPATWRDTIKSSRWTVPTIIGSTVIGGLLLYNYIKKLFQRSNEESLKHTIINNAIIILNNESKKKLEKLDEEQFNRLISQCIQKGDAAWKQSITPPMLNGLAKKIAEKIKAASDWNSNVVPVPESTISRFMHNNKNLFEGVRLTTVVEEYTERTRDTITKNMKTIESIIEIRGTERYLKEWGSPQENSDNNSVERYKIHLMPKYEDLISTVKKIHSSKQLSNIAIATKFRQIFCGMTAGYSCPSDASSNKKCLCANKGTYDIGPMIVIYTSRGKTQQLLDEVYNVFKDQEGLNVTPQFNKKITSLIYYAQGNSICKIFNPELYEQPNLIHYKPTIKSTKIQIINTTKGRKEYNEVNVQYYKEPIHNRYHLLHPDRMILPLQQTSIPTPLIIEEEK